MGSLRTALVPLVAMPVSLIGAAIVMFAFGFSLNLLTILAIVLSVGLVVDDAIVVVENVERHVREGELAHRRGADRRARTRRPDHRDDDHARRGLHADRLPGRPDRHPVPRVRDHARRGGRRVGHRRRHPLAGHELALRASPTARKAGWPCAGEPRLRGRTRHLRAAARRRDRDALGDRRRRRCSSWSAAWPLYRLLAARARAGRGPEPHRPLLRGVARLHGRGDPIASRRRSSKTITGVPRSQVHVVADRARGAASAGMVAKDWRAAQALDRGDVRRRLRRGLAGAGAARLSRASTRRCRTPANTTSSW